MEELSLPLYATDAGELDLPFFVEGLLAGSPSPVSLPGNRKHGWMLGMMGGGTPGWKAARAS